MTYEEIRTRVDADAHVEAMLATPLGQLHPDLMEASIRQDATEVWRRADGSPAPEADARAFGASLVLLALNVRQGVQS